MEANLHRGCSFQVRGCLYDKPDNVINKSCSFIIGRRQDRLTLNVRNRMDRDRKLIFFIVGMGVLLIAIGLGLLLLHKLYGEDVKEIRPVVVIGILLREIYIKNFP